MTICNPGGNFSFQVNFVHKARKVRRKLQALSFRLPAWQVDNLFKSLIKARILRPLIRQFVPLKCVGNILDSPTFAHNFEVHMKKNDVQTNASDLENQVNNSININTDENIDGNQHLNEPVEEESEILRLNEQLQEGNDRYLRLVAEFENFKRRNAKERIELIQTAGKDVIVDILDVLDDSERAQKQWEITDDVKSIKEGVQLVFTKLRNTLSAKGLKPMDVIGKDFN